MAEPGSFIGPYRLISPLGRGAMGEVWRAKDERLDRYVAMKVIPPDYAGSTERRARMLREARAAAAVRHANVVTLFDIVEQGSEDILVMELVEGKTLSDRLRQSGPASLETTLRWLESITDALATAHGRGILHRDIKAANIMIADDEQIKVLDFGLAKIGDTLLDAERGDRSPAESAQRLLAHRAAISETLPSSGEFALGSPHSGQIDSNTGDRTPGMLPHEISASRRADLSTYQTDAGSLLGTPMYMAPEQVTGGSPDQRSEVYSIGVLAYEMLAGRPPYPGKTVEQVFEQIAAHTPVAPQGLHPAVWTVVQTCLAKQPDQRFASMKHVRDAVIATRRKLFAPRAKRWPLYAAIGGFFLAVITSVCLWWFLRKPTLSPADSYVVRALEEYDVFFGDKALSSLRSALAEQPNHPQALAYMVLFGGAPDADREAALSAAEATLNTVEERSKARALLASAIALSRKGPARAVEAITASGATLDRELKFWVAEFQMRAGDYAAAQASYAELLASGEPQFRGRIYDHYSAVLLYYDRPSDALRLGKLYRDAFPGEADAVGVYATTLAMAGKLDEALAAARDAVRLAEGEDTLAGLAKVHALRGETDRAKELYRKSMERARDARKPIRRAALALLQWIDGDTEAARATVAPCFAPTDEGRVRQRGACLFVAGLVDRQRSLDIALDLEKLAKEANAVVPSYGDPQVLADLLRAYHSFSGYGCLMPRGTSSTPAPSGDPAVLASLRRVYEAPFDFYVTYHLPMLASWQTCEAASLDVAVGNARSAEARLGTIVDRAPGRFWVERTLKSLPAQ